MNNYSLSLCDFGLSQFYPQNFNCYILIPIKVWIKKKKVIVLFKLTNFVLNFQLQLFHFFIIRDKNFILI